MFKDSVKQITSIPLLFIFCTQNKISTSEVQPRNEFQGAQDLLERQGREQEL